VEAREEVGGTSAAHSSMTQQCEDEKLRREGEAGESATEVAEVPHWSFEQKHAQATVRLPYRAVKGSVQARFAKEGMLVDFMVGAKHFNLVVQTYAPVVPGWCKVEVKPHEILVVLSKAKGGEWGFVGELCSAEAAGLAAEEATLLQQRLEPPVAAEPEGTKENCPQGDCKAKDEAEEDKTEDDGAEEEEGPMKYKLSFQPASCYQGFRDGYVFQMGPDGLGYYQDVGPFCKLVPPSESSPTEEEEKEPQTMWDWVQEARAGGKSTSLESKVPKPAFQRGFMEEKSQKKEVEEEEFEMPDIDGDDDDFEEEEEESGTVGRVDAVWMPTRSMKTQQLVLELD